MLTPVVNHVLFSVLSDSLFNNQVTDCPAPPIPSSFTHHDKCVSVSIGPAAPSMTGSPEVREHRGKHSKLCRVPHPSWAPDSSKDEGRNPLHLHCASLSRHRADLPPSGACPTRAPSRPASPATKLKQSGSH